MKESNKKDCVLIIDHETGEITLERLTDHILLKKTRSERNHGGGGQGTSGMGSQPSSRPSTPMETGGGGGGSKRASPGMKASNDRFGTQITEKVSSAAPGRSHSPAGAYFNSSNSRNSSPKPSGSSNDGFSGVNINDMLEGLGDGGGGRPNSSKVAKKTSSISHPSKTSKARHHKPTAPQPLPQQQQHHKQPPINLADIQLSESSSDSDSSSSDRYGIVGKI